MYGYVVVDQPELKFREYAVYRSYYCGLCDALKKGFGFKGQISLSYDCTFLVILLSSLYEPETVYKEKHCVAHPIHKHPVRYNHITDYVADMNILLTYYKCLDDWKDEKKLFKKAYGDTLKRKVKKIEAKYPEKAKTIKECLDELSKLEKNNEKNIDKPAATFGRLMAELLVMKKEDIWREQLSVIGNGLGRFIYILDAYDDIEKDINKGNYNVLIERSENIDFDEFVESVLKSYMAGCARAFEQLPIIDNVDLLRNIIYSGVWTRFNMARNKRKKLGEKND